MWIPFIALAQEGHPACKKKISHQQSWQTSGDPVYPGVIAVKIGRLNNSRKYYTIEGLCERTEYVPQL